MSDNGVYSHSIIDKSQDVQELLETQFDYLLRVNTPMTPGGKSTWYEINDIRTSPFNLACTNNLYADADITLTLWLRSKKVNELNQCMQEAIYLLQKDPAISNISSNKENEKVFINFTVRTII